MKKYPVIIDPEFRALIPPMSADSLAQLEANIREHGLRERLTLWRYLKDEYILIDGHHRFEILKRLVKEEDSRFYGEDLSYHNGTKDIYSVVELVDHDAVKLWILENQVGRRNLTKEQRIEMVARIVMMRQEQTEKTKRANLKIGAVAPEVGKMPTSGKKTVEDAAREFGVPQKPLQQAVTAVKDNQPKPTACDICHAPFESRGAMKAHRQKNHGEEMATRRNGKTSLRSPVEAPEIPSQVGCSNQTIPLQNQVEQPIEAHPFREIDWTTVFVTGDTALVVSYFGKDEESYRLFKVEKVTSKIVFIGSNFRLVNGRADLSHLIIDPQHPKPTEQESKLFSFEEWRDVEGNKSTSYWDRYMSAETKTESVEDAVVRIYRYFENSIKHLPERDKKKSLNNSQVSSSSAKKAVGQMFCSTPHRKKKQARSQTLNLRFCAQNYMKKSSGCAGLRDIGITKEITWTQTHV